MEIGEPVCLAEVRVPRGEVTCADVSEGGWLAAGGGDGKLRMWRWRRGAGWGDEITARAHRYGVTCVRFSERGGLAASGGVDGAVRVWAAALVERRELAAGGAAAVRALCWAGGRLVVGHDDGAVCVWTARAAQLLVCLRAHEGAVHALATLSDHALLLTACTESVLKVFDLEAVVSMGAEGASVSPLVWEDGVHELGAACAAAASDGSAAATGGRDGRVRLWRVRGAGRERIVVVDGELAGHTDAVTALSWAGQLLASSSQDRTARLWEPRSRCCVRVLQAHARYLTAVAICRHLRYMITGSNDKSVRTWSLGSFTIDDEIRPDCNPLSHFALGDLQGIGPVEDVAELEVLEVEGLGAEPGQELEPGRGADLGVGQGAELGTESSRGRCVWREQCGAAVNCLATGGDLLAAACSDGRVLVYRVSDVDREVSVQALYSLPAHNYPALAVDFSGALLLSGGLDASARLWDAQTGRELATLDVQGVGGGAGGGGVRGARLSGSRPPRLLLASDAGAAAVWDIDPLTPQPTHVYSPCVEAATCCAWAGGWRLLAVGGSDGELRLCRSPPDATMIACETDAHDLGVLSCDFAPDIEGEEEQSESSGYLLASGGRDALVKVWRAGEGGLRLLSARAAHGGAVQSVRWGTGSGGTRLLATGGADRWARVWRVAAGALLPLGAVSVHGAGGAGAVLPLGRLLAVGALGGELALWALPASPPDHACATPREWGPPAIARWLSEYVTRCPGSTISEDVEEQLLERGRSSELTGARLLDDPLAELLGVFGCEEEDTESELSMRLRDEILWLRRQPLPYELESSVPHTLLCPLTHLVMFEPVRAADGYTYDRAALAEWMFAEGDELRSPMTGRRLASALIEPNYGVRDQLRTLLAELLR